MLLCIVSSHSFYIQNRTVTGPGTNSRRKSIDRRSSPEDNKAQLMKEAPPQRRQSQSRKLPIDLPTNVPKVHIGYTAYIDVTTCCTC